MENGDQPATKKDLGELRTELKQDNEQLRSELHHAYDDLKEMFRDGQTELLKAFYSYAQSTDAKLKESEVADMLLRSRLTAVESRVTEIERRVNQPPLQTH
jgi:hypothetical protein